MEQAVALPPPFPKHWIITPSKTRRKLITDMRDLTWSLFLTNFSKRDPVISGCMMCFVKDLATLTTCSSEIMKRTELWECVCSACAHPTTTLRFIVIALSGLSFWQITSSAGSLPYPIHSFRFIKPFSCLPDDSPIVDGFCKSEFRFSPNPVSVVIPLHCDVCVLVGWGGSRTIIETGILSLKKLKDWLNWLMVLQ